MIGTITKDPEKKTSGAGNVYLYFPVAVDPADGSPTTWWNMKIMENLFSILPEGLLEKRRYMKFVGLGTKRPYKKDGQDRVSNDMIVTGIEMQNGDFLRTEKAEKEPGDD